MDIWLLFLPPALVRFLLLSLEKLEVCLTGSFNRNECRRSVHFCDQFKHVSVSDIVLTSLTTGCTDWEKGTVWKTGVGFVWPLCRGKDPAVFPSHFQEKWNTHLQGTILISYISRWRREDHSRGRNLYYKGRVKCLGGGIGRVFVQDTGVHGWHSVWLSGMVTGFLCFQFLKLISKVLWWRLNFKKNFNEIFKMLLISILPIISVIAIKI